MGGLFGGSDPVQMIQPQPIVEPRPIEAKEEPTVVTGDVKDESRLRNINLGTKQLQIGSPLGGVFSNLKLKPGLGAQ